MTFLFGVTGSLPDATFLCIYKMEAMLEFAPMT
jgi:hypothetical protein